jgi:glycosyltransferase involved in cell wall biosynthesis
MSGGYQSYLRTLIPLLLRDPRLSGLAVFSHRKVLAALATSDHVALTWRGYTGPKDLRRAIAEWNPNVALIPTARWLPLAVPTTVMVRNMEPLAFAGSPGSVGEQVRNVLRRRAARTSCTRADRVIAVSGYVRDYLLDEFRLPAHKIGVVYHGARRTAHVDKTRRPAGLSGAITSGFIFTAGSIRPARGLEDLIRALAILRDQGRVIPALIAGQVDRGGYYHDSIRRLAVRAGVQDQVHWLGQLDAAEMGWCYDNAYVFAMTSRVEACPNTALEAMAHGAACIATDCPPMPEIFARAARYYCPGDALGFAREFGCLIHDPGRRDAARAEARARASCFSWERTARCTIDQLEATTPS